MIDAVDQEGGSKYALRSEQVARRNDGGGLHLLVSSRISSTGLPGTMAFAFATEHVMDRICVPVSEGRRPGRTSAWASSRYGSSSIMRVCRMGASDKA